MICKSINKTTTRIPMTNDNNNKNNNDKTYPQK